MSIVTKELDKKDWKILQHLCTNARQSHNKLGKLVGLSKNSVTYRVERLVERGVISGFFSIIDSVALGFYSYTMLLRISSTAGREKEFVDYLKGHPNVKVLDKLLGEWNFIIEAGFKGCPEFNSFLEDLKSKFSDIIDVYEVHFPTQSYNSEGRQLPMVVEEENPAAKKTPHTKKHQAADNMDMRLLRLLDSDSSSQLLELGGKLGLTYETVSARIKRLLESGVIKKFTAKISLPALGYEVYLILMECRNLSKEKEQMLQSYINAQKNVRHSFLSATRPTLFLYLPVKSAADLNKSLSAIKERFSDVIVSQKYLLSTAQLKYQLFPEGFLKN